MEASNLSENIISFYQTTRCHISEEEEEEEEEDRQLDIRS
jgi:hypothetical protein